MPSVVARAGDERREGKGNNVAGEYCSLDEDGNKADDRTLMEKETDFLEVWRSLLGAWPTAAE